MIKKNIKKRTGIKALGLALLLMMGLIPTGVSAAESKDDIPLIGGMRVFSETKLVQIPNSSRKILVMSLDNGENAEGNNGIYYSNETSYGSFSVPHLLKDDTTCDMQPYVYADSHASNDNNIIITWTDANKEIMKASSNEKMEEAKAKVAGSMRISIAVMNSQTLAPSFEPYTFTGSDSDDVCHYNSRVTKVGNKVLITWVVCEDVKNDAGAYSIEGLYYDPEANSFSTNDNATDENGKLLPMVFAENCNYISAYSVAEVDNAITVLFEEATDGTRVSDVLYNIIYKEGYWLDPEPVKTKELNLVTFGRGTVHNIVPADTDSSIVETDLSELDYYHDGNIFRISGSPDSSTGLKTDTIADVSGTGDTRYSVISKQGSIAYISAREYTSLKTDKTEVTIGGKKYTKTADGKWIDEQNKECDLCQEDIRLYYYNSEADKFTLLPLKLLGSNENAFATAPGMILDDSDRLDVLWNRGDIEGGSFELVYTVYEQPELLKANYQAVKEAIRKADALNQDDYVDFSAVTEAIEAVEYNKDYTEQATVDGYAEAIENAVKALVLRSADYTAVDAAIAKARALNGNLYKNFSDVTAAVKAVDRNKNFKEQAEVDAMAQAIEDAIAALKYKDADYSKVDAAIAKAKALNKNDYKDFTAVEKAMKAVIRGKNIKEQAEVDAMAQAIEDAIHALKKKPADPKPTTSEAEESTETTETSATETTSMAETTSTTETASTTEKQGQADGKVPQTGDNSNLMLWITLLFISGGMLTGMTVFKKER